MLLFPSYNHERPSSRTHARLEGIIETDLLPIILIQPFVDAGVFGTSSEPAPFREWTVAFPGITGSLTLYPDDQALVGVLIVAEEEKLVTLRMGFAPLKHGSRRYWLCEACAERCRLLVGGDAFLCKGCFRRQLSNLSWRSRIQALNSSEAAADGGLVIVRDADEPVRQNSRKRARSANELHHLKTQTAFSRGRGCNQIETYEILQQMPEERRFNLPTDPKYVRPETIEFVDRAPMLNINVVWQHMTSDLSLLNGQTLQWSDVAGGPIMAIFLDRRGPEPLLLISYDWADASDPHWQRLLVHFEPGGRRRFICPITGKRYDDLYLRDGIFASRDALRLIHPKQRQRKRKAVTGHG